MPKRRCKGVRVWPLTLSHGVVLKAPSSTHHCFDVVGRALLISVMLSPVRNFACSGVLEGTGHVCGAVPGLCSVSRQGCGPLPVVRTDPYLICHSMWLLWPSLDYLLRKWGIWRLFNIPPVGVMVQLIALFLVAGWHKVPASWSMFL